MENKIPKKRVQEICRAFCWESKYSGKLKAFFVSPIYAEVLKNRVPLRSYLDFYNVNYIIK